MRAPQYSRNPKEIFSPKFIVNPFPLYKRLREKAPISEIGNSGFHLITSWDLVREVLKREQEFSANLLGVLYRSAEGVPACFNLSETGALSVIATADGDDHARHRKILAPALTKKAVAEYECYVRDIVIEEIEELLFYRGGSCVHTIEKIPALVIGKLLGLPLTESAKFIQWSMIGGLMLAGEISASELEFLSRETNEMKNYLLEKFESSLLHKEGKQTLLALLREACDEEEITKEEAIGIAIILFGAGGESTSAVMGSAIFHLASLPDIQKKLRENNQLIDIFIEEIIRFSPPFKFHYRSVRAKCMLGGYDLAIGDKLLLSWDSVGHRFLDPVIEEITPSSRGILMYLIRDFAKIA